HPALPFESRPHADLRTLRKASKHHHGHRPPPSPQAYRAFHGPLAVPRREHHDGSVPFSVPWHVTPKILLQIIKKSLREAQHRRARARPSRALGSTIFAPQRRARRAPSGASRDFTTFHAPRGVPDSPSPVHGHPLPELPARTSTANEMCHPAA